MTHIFNVRHDNRFGLDKSIFENKALIGALIISVGLLLLAVYVPFMQNVMGTEGITLTAWGILFAVAAIVTLINHIIKKIFIALRENK